jgi:hypothetical protein
MKFLCLIICAALAFTLIPEIFGDLISSAITNLMVDTKDAIFSGVG